MAFLSIEAIAKGIHPVQIAFVATAMSLNVLGLVFLNRLKQQPHHISPCTTATWSWQRRRYAYWALIGALLAVSCFLDAYYPTDERYFIVAKGFVVMFPVGLLDLYFSDNRGVPFLGTFFGWSMWIVTGSMRQFITDKHFADTGGAPFFILQPTDFSSIKAMGMEVARFGGMIVGAGVFSDLIFSPMHRLTHSSLYKTVHKKHHEYTNKLTCLLNYHGTAIDDFLMPLTTVVGFHLYYILLGTLVPGGELGAQSNLTWYLMVVLSLFNHAHDIRCADILTPGLPSALNFVAYHSVHHLAPSHNYGLTVPSDFLWDFLLGVNTMMTREDAVAFYQRTQKAQD